MLPPLHDDSHWDDLDRLEYDEPFDPHTDEDARAPRRSRNRSDSRSFQEKPGTE